MDNLLLPLVETSIALIVFYGVYIFMLQRETLFLENRFYLLFTAIISLLIPWANFSLPLQTTQSLQVYNLIDTVTITANGYEQSFLQSISNAQWVWLVYLLGVIATVTLFIVKIIWVLIISKKSVAENRFDLPKNLRFVKANVAPFSFLNTIYINPDKHTDNQITDIIAHEQVHVRQRHTYDCLFYELLIALLWFNPIVYRYRASAKAIHEFLADEGAIRSGISDTAYKTLLLEQATGLRMQPIANSFNYSLVKRRLIMLTKSKSSKWTRAKFMFVLPVIIVFAVVFSCNDAEKEASIITQSTELGNTETATEDVYYEVEEMPIFKGGDQALREFIAQNVKYPDDAKIDGIQGRVFVQFNVDVNGKVCDTKVLRGISESIDAEALRVISKLPDWTPGMQDGKNVKVSFTIPINFALK